MGKKALLLGSIMTLAVLTVGTLVINNFFKVKKSLVPDVQEIARVVMDVPN
jgi:hypothetical protein